MRKGLRRRLGTLTSVLVLGMILPWAAGAKNRLVAPVYPGAVRGGAEGSVTDFEDYCTNAPFAGVRSFYEQKLGHRIKGNFIGTGKIYSYNESRAEAGVNIFFRQNSSGPVSRVFEKLADLARPGLPGARSPAELKTLERKYGYLKKSYYPRADDEYHTVDQVIFDKYAAELEGAETAQVVDNDAMTAKIQALAAQGRFEEMMALSEKMAANQTRQANETLQGKKGGMDPWENWVACLREMAAKACSTAINIDMDQ